MTAHHANGGADDTITLPITASDLPIYGSNLTINGAGSYNLFLGGTNDTVNLTGGNETVTAYFGHNTINLSGGNNLVQIGGTGNVITAGKGDNTIWDIGSGNTYVLPTAGTGTDTIWAGIGGIIDTLDLQPLLAKTNWNGNTAALGNFLEVVSPTTGAENGGDAVLMARNTVHQAWSAVAVFKDCGGLTLSNVLAHATT